MPIKGVRLCGAKCRTKNGGPCERTAVRGGVRCRIHGGKGTRYTHGRCSQAAKEERRVEVNALRDMKKVIKELEG